MLKNVVLYKATSAFIGLRKTFKCYLIRELSCLFPSFFPLNKDFIVRHLHHVFKCFGFLSSGWGNRHWLVKVYMQISCMQMYESQIRTIWSPNDKYSVLGWTVWLDLIFLDFVCFPVLHAHNYSAYNCTVCFEVQCKQSVQIFLMSRLFSWVFTIKASQGWRPTINKYITLTQQRTVLFFLHIFDTNCYMTAVMWQFLPSLQSHQHESFSSFVCFRIPLSKNKNLHPLAHHLPK